MLKAIFIIVPSYSNNSWLDSKMMQLTKSFIAILNIDNYPVEIVENYDDINQFLDKAELLIVSTAGNIIIEKNHLRNKIFSIPDTVGLLAHLLQYNGDQTPYMHEQFFIIRTKAFKTLNFKQLKRSQEDMHDGHAPLFLTLEDGYINFGTFVIEECLVNGYEVRNFDNDWRYPKTATNYIALEQQLPSRGYCYPKDNSDLFASALKELTLCNGLNESQQLLILGFKKVLEFNVLNAQQTETLYNCNPAETVICPATGFLAEAVAIKAGASDIIIYDKNPNNIEFKKHLYKNWDGINYIKFAQDFATKHNLSIEPSFDSDIENAKTQLEETNIIISNWVNWKDSVKITFVCCDLVKQIDQFQLNNNTLIHTSSILTMYPLSAISYDQDEIESVRQIIYNSKAQWFEI